MIRIKSYAKSKNTDNGTSTTSSGSGFVNQTTVVENVKGVNIWGQYHDHQSDVSGDMSGVGNINSNGNVNCNNVTAQENIEAYGDVNASNVTAENQVECSFLECEDTAYTDTLVAEHVNTTEITGDTAYFETLTVQQAHFFELVIDQVRATQGQIVLSPANGKVAKVELIEDPNFRYYKLYFRCTDGDKRIYQRFEIDDQIYCQKFNVEAQETSTFYWCLVEDSSMDSTVLIDIDGHREECFWITVNLDDSHSAQPITAIPQAGDEIVVMGNRTDTDRQNVQILGAYNLPLLDPNVKAPFFVQYVGVDDYDLPSHRRNTQSRDFNQFVGAFYTTNGDNIEDLINDITVGALTYVHTAYSTSADGRNNFSKTYFNGAIYMGICSNRTESDTALTYSDYEWIRIKGQDGGTAEIYKLSPITEQFPIDSTGTVGIFLRYYVQHIVGTQIENITTSASMNAYWKIYYQTGTTQAAFTVGTQTPSYNNAQVQTNYNTQANKVQYAEIILASQNPAQYPNATIYDRRIVYPQLLPSASFTITDSIQSTVQGHTTQISNIDGRVTSNTNSISTVQQQADGIQSTVQSHTTQINNIDGRVTQNTTDISTVNQRAGQIETNVQNLETNTQSWIRQSADDIEEKVNNTGININDGTITLNADTTKIYGNLSLNNPQQGLIIYDEYKNPRITIQNETLGNLEDFDFGTDEQLDSQLQTTVASSPYTVTLPTFQLGSFTSGQTLKIFNINVRSYLRETANYNNNLTSMGYSLVIKANGTTVNTLTGMATFDSNTLTYVIPDHQSTITTDGDYTADLTITGTFIDTTQTGTYYHYAYLYVSHTQPNINKIAIDGAVFASSTEDYNWFGSDKTQIKSENSIVRIEDGHIMRNPQDVQNPNYTWNTFCDLSTQMPYAFVNDIEYHAGLNDGLIVFGNTQPQHQHTLYLPQPNICPGKVYYVKNLFGYNTLLRVENAESGSNYFVNTDSTSKSATLNIQDDSAIFISCLYFWIRMS
jgi:hypothetical protein